MKAWHETEMADQTSGIWEYTKVFHLISKALFGVYSVCLPLPTHSKNTQYILQSHKVV